MPVTSFTNFHVRNKHDANCIRKYSTPMAGFEPTSLGFSDLKSNTLTTGPNNRFSDTFFRDCSITYSRCALISWNIVFVIPCIVDIFDASFEKLFTDFSAISSNHSYQSYTLRMKIARGIKIVLCCPYPRTVTCSAPTVQPWLWTTKLLNHGVISVTEKILSQVKLCTIWHPE